MVKLTEEQKKEHRVIEHALDILERVCERFENDEDVDPKIIEKTIDFLRTFADKCHHGKEQDLLFIALEMEGMSRVNSPIGILRREHDIARRFIWNMDRALGDYKKGDETAKKDILQSAQAYNKLLNQHIDKEDDLLYPIAEKKLSDERKRELLKAYERFEKEVTGKGLHEKYHTMIENLTEQMKIN